MTNEELHNEFAPWRMWHEHCIWGQRIPHDFKFKVGSRYLTLEGKIVTIVEYKDENKH